ncbi:MAG: hypothetical protein PF693_21555 [Spirochaetia bacterium]|jgi:hypothetical protein|nr:hypothetical protein [Spirochaetia bacterium]
MNEPREDLIHLKNAHATQYTDDNGKSVWHIRKNLTSENLFDLPGDMKEKDVFSALHLARFAEMEAWNAGIQFGKNEILPVLQIEREKVMKVIHELEQANNRLANKLGELIGEEEE